MGVVLLRRVAAGGGDLSVACGDSSPFQGEPKKEAEPPPLSKGRLRGMEGRFSPKWGAERWKTLRAGTHPSSRAAMMGLESKNPWGVRRMDSSVTCTR